MSELLELPWSEARGQVGPREYVDACLKAIDAHDGELHAFLHVDKEAGQGTLPIAIKDNIVTTGLPTTCASQILRDFVSPYDATAVTRLRARGAAVVGKANLDEFAMGSSTEHSAFGVTRNPWDLERVAGGSSGGSAAAVAARMVPVALGSETGGSVRQPAAFCGVVGLKPTYGRVSRWGLVAFASGLDQIGIVTKTTRDCAEVLRIIAGHDPLDSTSSTERVDDYAADLSKGVKGLRFGVVTEAVERLEGEVRANFDAAVEVLRGGGAIVEMIGVPSIVYAIAIYYVVANAEASANLSRFDGVRYGHRAEGCTDLRELYMRSRAEGFGEEVRRRILVGTYVLSHGYYDAYYLQAQRVRRLIADDFARAFAEVDVIMGPVAPTVAWDLGAKRDDPIAMYLADIYTLGVSLAGLPGMSIPCGVGADGRRPVGLQLIGRWFDEARLLAVAHAFQQATDWHRRRPAA